MVQELTAAAISEFATAWYQALDRHDDIDEVFPLLVDSGLVMNFPEGTSKGHDGFREWYDAVTTRFFDEVHTVREVKPLSLSPKEAEVSVLVNWQAKMHEGQTAKSSWLGFDAYQTWTVVPGVNGPQ
ncbi:MAG TPA: nuclear transport factor 2 family protein, partial [Pseudonocardiaceae bacterium]|nr:nuclear transport factor 2 family protein [Pseudonocardiaceae bacterium]